MSQLKGEGFIFLFLPPKSLDIHMKNEYFKTKDDNKSLDSSQYGLSLSPKSKKQGKIPPIKFDMGNVG